eukprot:TRINITY_DN7579_c0_g1_i1.p1 TRINITY_DN7579_c0_g1~~TRINITY_DN7579_c0_g1_i1.p1  ORF type:complete len:679 (+),score=220.97 TRINITY_DN7579_c0_g1_i1:216-2252(+)
MIGGERRGASAPQLYYKQAQLQFRNLLHTRIAGSRRNTLSERLGVAAVLCLMVLVVIGFVMNFAAMFERPPEHVALSGGGDGQAQGSRVHVVAANDWSLLSHIDRPDQLRGDGDHAAPHESQHLQPSDAAGILHAQKESRAGGAFNTGGAPLTASELRAREQAEKERGEAFLAGRDALKRRDGSDDVQRARTRPLPRPTAAALTDAFLEEGRARADRWRSQDPPASNKRNAIRDAFKHAWDGYEKGAFGHDELRPVSGITNDSWGGFGITLIDALDTLLLMGFGEEFQRALEHVRSIDWEKDYDASFFESTIRYLGGLLGAYHLSNEPVLLDQAIDLGDRLVAAFDAPSGLPFSIVNLETGIGKNPSWTSGNNILSEIGSVQLEFAALSFFSGKPKYFRTADAVMREIALYERPEGVPDGLWPVYLNGRERSFATNQISFGGLGDSFYEYLLKMSKMTGERRSSPTAFYWQQYNEAVVAMRRHLVTTVDDYTFVSEYLNSPTNAMDHLTCFVPGMLFLGADSHDEDTMDLAAELLRTCVQLYRDQPTGLGPERVLFMNRGEPSAKKSKLPYIVQSGKYLLRPEVAESIFYAWRKTKDPAYREMGWDIFQAIEKHCRTEYAYSGLEDVTREGAPQNDSMQSFFFAETLKYLYLLFSPDDELDLTTTVFNTEAHPLPVLG